MEPLKVQFVHGLESSSQGAKARYLAERFETLTLDMDTADPLACVARQAAGLRTFRPDVLVGSSFGGGVVVELLRRGVWTGPTLLLAQAARRHDPTVALPEGVPVLLVHGSRDAVIDPADSRGLAQTGSPGRVRLIEVDDDHRLTAEVAEDRLAGRVREAWRMGAEPAEGTP